MKKVLLSIAALSVITAAIAIFITRPYVAAYVDQEIISLARQRNVLVSIDSSSIGIAYWQATGVTVSAMAGAAPVNLELSSVRVALPVLSLLKLAPQVLINGEAYGGSFRAAAGGSPNDGQVSVDIKQVNLARTHYAPLIGVESAVLSLNMPHMSLQSGRATSANGTITLSDFTLSPTYHLLLSAIFPLIPKVPVKSFVGAAEFQFDSRQDRLIVQNISLSGNLGTASGSAIVQYISLRARQTISADFDITLSAEGKQHVGGYLALAAGKSPENPAERYSIAISGNIKSPRWKVTAR